MKKVKDFLRLTIAVTVAILLLAFPIVIIFLGLAETLGYWKSLSVTTSIIAFSCGLIALLFIFLE